ncbi:Transposase [Paraliobacillus sp. PM-2]|nr:Transposase [Paraliobacillus sp. PM-2]
MRKTYDKDFKLQAVHMVKEDGKRIAEVARELDLAEQTLHNWVKKHNQGKDDAFVGSGNVQREKRWKMTYKNECVI